MRDYYYDYGFEFDSKERAFDVAKGFHEALVGVDDYINDNIILSFEGPRVALSVYPESKIEIRVEDSGFGPYLDIRW